MPGLEETANMFRYRVRDPSAFDKFRVKEIGSGGVKITLGRIKGTNRWEVQNYIFEKQLFKTREQVKKWLDEHLKAQIQMLTDYRAWNEYVRRNVNAYMQISKIE